MFDGRIDPEFYRAIAARSASDRQASDSRAADSRAPRDDVEGTFDPVVPRIWMSVAGLLAMICLLSLG